MRRRATTGVLALGLLLGAASCSNETCDQNQSALPLAVFRDAATGASVSVRGLAVGAVGAPGDSLLLDTAQTASQVYLPFDMTASETVFFLRYAAGEADTLRVAYDRQPYFASEACGAMYRFRIRRLEHTSLLLDSVAVTDSLVTNLDRPCMALYLRTAP